jgi:signal transduction histidine kinase
LTRRILVALVGLTVLLLAGVVVPLGVFTAQHDQQVFVESANATALGIANQAEEKLADPRESATRSTGTLTTGLHANPGDQISVYDLHGHPLAGTPTAISLSVAGSVAGQGQTGHRWISRPDRYLVVLPVTSAGRLVGVAALARPSHALHEEQRRLWISLFAAGLAALAAAAGLALALARWVGRPLRRLDAAAAQLGEGTLTARANTDAGPGEVKALAVTFNQMAGRLESLLAGQRNVIADVSHQLRTPLAALRLRLELLRQDSEGATGIDLDGTLDEVNRLSRLVDGMLAVARAENTNPAPTDVDVAAVTQGRVEAWTPVAADSGVALTSTATDTSALLTPGHLEQILDNLLANAIEATPPGGHITVDVSSTAKRTYIKVSDTGPGMTQLERQNARRRYWSADTNADAATSDRQGSGLGLAIVDRLVAVDQGRLTLEEAPSGGLAATIELASAESTVRRGHANSRSV